MKRMILITLLIGFIMGSMVIAQCQVRTTIDTDPNDPNNPGQEMGLPACPVIWQTEDPNDPNIGGE